MQALINLAVIVAPLLLLAGLAFMLEPKDKPHRKDPE